MKSLFRLPVIIGALPVTLTNGTTADATQVMSDLNWIINQVNANAAPLANTALTNANNNFTVVQSGTAATAPSHFPIASQVQNWSFNTLSSTLGTNTITARVAALPLSAYGTGQVFTLIPSQTNTGAVTLAVDGLPATAVLSYSLPLAPGYLRAGVPVDVSHDGVNFNLLPTPQAQIQNAVLTTLTSTVGSQAITTRVVSLPLAAYSTGQVFSIIPASSNNFGGVTINVDSLGAKALAVAGATTIGKELIASVPAVVQFDGSQLNLLTRHPGRVLLASQTAAGSATIDFTNINSAYDVYEVECVAILPATNNVGFSLRMSIDGGTTFKAGATDYVYANQVLNVGGVADNASSGAGATFISLSPGTDGLSNAASSGFNGTVKLYNVNSTSQRKFTTVLANCVGNTSSEVISGGGQTILAALSTSAVNAIRFLMTSGNIASGTFYLYGVRKT